MNNGSSSIYPFIYCVISQSPNYFLSFNLQYINLYLFNCSIGIFTYVFLF